MKWCWKTHTWAKNDKYKLWEVWKCSTGLKNVKCRCNSTVMTSWAIAGKHQGQTKLAHWDVQTQACMRMNNSSSGQKKVISLMDGARDDKLPRRGALKAASLAGTSWNWSSWLFGSTSWPDFHQENGLWKRLTECHLLTNFTSCFIYAFSQGLRFRKSGGGEKKRSESLTFSVHPKLCFKNKRFPRGLCYKT